MSVWKISESLKHPTIQKKASVDKQAYSQINIGCPKQNYCKINIVTDTCAQSCLWDLDSYMKYAFLGYMKIQILMKIFKELYLKI